MRVLLVADVDALTVRGGAERLLAGHARGLADRGHRVSVCSAAPGPAGMRDGVRTFRVGRTPATPLRAAAAVGSLRPDVVVGYQPACALGALLAAKGLGIPTAYVFSSCWHEEHVTRRRRPTRAGVALRRSVERACLRASDRIVVLSEYSATKVRHCHRLDGAGIRLVPGGVDVRRFSPDGGPLAARARLGLPAQGPLLLAVRNLVPRTGLDSLVAAMPIVLRTFPRARLLVAGEGPLRSMLEASVATRRLDRHVAFTGFVSEESLPDYYRAADLAILPTRALEGFGLATVEALACGTPVVGTPVGATPELLAPLDSGLVTEDATPEAIAAGIVRLLARDPARLGERARSQVLSHYTWEIASAGLERVLEEVVR